MVHVEPGRPWADLVFHVLAHVSATAHLAASVHDPVYVAWSEARLGPASGRTLGEDAALLGRMLPGHDELGRAQLLAVLFDDLTQASAAATVDLADISVPPSREPLRRWLVEGGSPVEVLRCAALLESEAHARLPAPSRTVDDVAEVLSGLVPVAPDLELRPVRLTRALRLRGRVLGETIHVGVPSEELDLTAEHVAWQAAHEASVHEVVRRSVGLSFDETEATAVLLLAERARATGLRARHRSWLAHLGPGAPPSRMDDASPGVSRRVGEFLQEGQP